MQDEKHWALFHLNVLLLRSTWNDITEWLKDGTIFNDYDDDVTDVDYAHSWRIKPDVWNHRKVLSVFVHPNQ